MKISFLEKFDLEFLSKIKEMEEKEFLSRVSAVEACAKFLMCHQSRISQLIREGSLSISYKDGEGGRKIFHVKFLGKEFLSQLEKKRFGVCFPKKFKLLNSPVVSCFMKKDSWEKGNLSFSSSKRNPCWVSIEWKDFPFLSLENLFLYSMLSEMWDAVREHFSGEISFTFKEFFEFFKLDFFSLNENKLKKDLSIPSVFFSCIGRACGKTKDEEEGISVFQGEEKKEKFQSLLSLELLCEGEDMGFSLKEEPVLSYLDKKIHGNSVEIPFEYIFDRSQRWERALTRFILFRRILITKNSNGKMYPSIQEDWWEENGPLPFFSKQVKKTMEDAKKYGFLSSYSYSKEKGKNFLTWEYGMEKETLNSSQQIL